MKPTIPFKKLLLPALLGVALCVPAHGASYQFRLPSVGLLSPLAAPTIAPWVIGAVSVGGAPFTLTPPSSNSAGTFTFSSSDPLIASVSGDVVTILAAGTTTITANQAATASYLAGTTSASLLVNPPACSAPNSVYSNAATVNVTVPAGCTLATIKAWGAGGGGGYTAYSWQQNTGGAGGAGGFAKGTVSVTPGSKLAVVVGGSGGGSAGASPGSASGGSPGNGGYGANNNGSSTHLGGAGGGGYSGVFQGTVAQANALVVAGAGGGAGSEEHGSSLYAGGAGGGLTGVVSGTSASGGTQTDGGPPRGSGLATAGSALQGGGASQNNGGGGGGGGYFGGGGGGLNNCNSYGGCGYGGGGGSSFIISSATGASTIAGSISTTTSRAAAPNTGDVDYATSVGYGGAPGAPGQNGGRGKVVIIWSAQ